MANHAPEAQFVVLKRPVWGQVSELAAGAWARSVSNRHSVPDAGHATQVFDSTPP